MCVCLFSLLSYEWIFVCGYVFCSICNWNSIVCVAVSSIWLHICVSKIWEKEAQFFFFFFLWLFVIYKKRDEHVFVLHSNFLLVIYWVVTIKSFCFKVIILFFVRINFVFCFFFYLQTSFQWQVPLSFLYYYCTPSL